MGCRQVVATAWLSCVLFGGCLSSAMPLGGDLPGETNLAGRWETDQKSETPIPLGMQMFLKNGFQLTRHSDAFYELTVGEHRYDVEVSRVAGDLYLDVSPLIEEPDDDSPPLTLPLHVFLRFEQTENELKVYPWNVGAWNSAISSQKLPVVRPERERTVLVVESRKLRQLIIEDDDLFQQKPVVFHRSDD